jgi:hypothetical protein
MIADLTSIITQISKLPENWHAAGSVSPAVLKGIRRHAERFGNVRNTAETGSGKTTLLFSHLSRSHLVFAVDAGNGSVTQVRASPLFNAGSVTFVEGPTQLTLPRHTFTNPLQMVLLDGPHGYPFPDLEYYYFYPQIASGGILILDDIQIPTIGRMFDILNADEMFHLLEVIEKTAFLQRTEAPVISPTSDSWWLQGYNRAFYEQLVAPGQRTVSTDCAPSAPAEARPAPRSADSWWRRIVAR